jgi:quercetin dioxygenase-like cupin family protein
MKLVKIAVFALLAAMSAYAFAPQDPLAVGPGMYFLKMDNDRARVMVVKFAPGQSIGVHKHPDHVAYVLQGGRLQINEVGKESATMDIAAGTTLWLPAQSHSAKNVGKTHVKILVVEIK